MNDLDEVACSSTVKKDSTNTMYIDLKEVRKSDPNMAKLMKQFDYDNDDKVSPSEIARAAKLLDDEKKMNKKQGKLIVLLVIGYVIFGGTIGGLVYGIVKASKDSQVVSVTGMGSKPLMSVDGVDPEDIRPVSVNTNGVEPPLAIVGFVPDSMLPKFKSVTFSSGGDANDEKQPQTLMRRIAGIDVTPNVAFTIWTTIGDTLSWNSSHSKSSDTSPNKMMDVTLHDGTNYTLNILCSSCTAINTLWDDADIIAPYNSLLEHFDIQDLAYDSDENKHRHLNGCDYYYLFADLFVDDDHYHRLYHYENDRDSENWPLYDNDIHYEKDLWGDRGWW